VKALRAGKGQNGKSAVSDNSPGTESVDVVVYVPPPSGTCADKLVVAKQLLNLTGSVAMIDRGVAIESFALATLPLEDIFVKVVREGLGLDAGESGPPTVDQVAVAGGAR